MGTWGMKTFENDGNSDWVYDLEETNDLSLIEDALNPEETDYLEADEGEMILAAAEIINGIKSEPREGVPEECIEWINKHKSLNVSGLVEKATTLINLVLSEKSELRELWAENEEDYPIWEKNVLELKEKLNS